MPFTLNQNIVIGSAGWGGPVNANWDSIVNAFTANAPFSGIVAITAPAASGATSVGFSFAGGAHTAVPAGTEVTDVDINMARTVQWAGGTGPSGNRSMRVRRVTIAATTTSTFVGAISFGIDGPPAAGTNATLTTPMALNVASGTSFIGQTLTINNTATPISFTQLATSGGAASLMVVTAGTLSNQTAGAEVVDIAFNLNRVVTHATGALVTQRSIVVAAPTYDFTAASTLTTAATLAVVSSPVAGTNATITNAYALWIQAGQARFDGNISVGDAANLIAGSTSGTKLGTAIGQKLGFFNATPVALQSGTGTTAGFSAGAGTTMTSASTFTGNVGTSAYTFSDIVNALKTIGLLAQ